MHEVGFIPSEVNGGLVTLVFKKGDPLCTDNYRPVAVTEPIMRLYASILNTRLVDFTEGNDLRSHRVYEACVPPTAAYACKIWGFQQFAQQYGALRLELATSHLQMLKEITGVRGSTPTDILLAELGLKSLQHVWLLRAAKFWNSLVSKPNGTFYKIIALNCCKDAVAASRHNWAWSMFKAIR